jgi:hypothetical protein
MLEKYCEVRRLSPKALAPHPNRIFYILLKIYSREKSSL